MNLGENMDYLLKARFDCCVPGRCYLDGLFKDPFNLYDYLIPICFRCLTGTLTLIAFVDDIDLNSLLRDWLELRLRIVLDLLP